MNKFLEQALLFDFYGELLTDHQKEIYEQFALEDLSLSEIAEMKGDYPTNQSFINEIT